MTVRTVTHEMLRGPYYEPLTADRVAHIQDLLRLDCIDVTGTDHALNRLLPLWDYAQQMYNEDTGCDPNVLCEYVANMIRVCEGVGYIPRNEPPSKDKPYMLVCEVTHRVILREYAETPSQAEEEAYRKLNKPLDFNISNECDVLWVERTSTNIQGGTDL